MHRAPAVSVVIPTRGEPTYLHDALASVLAQDPRPEVVVVEDGTRLVDKASLEGAQLLQLHHVGRSAARNAGVDAVSTPFVAFLDADDVALPGRLERQRLALESNPGAVLSFGRIETIDEHSRLLPQVTEDERRRFDALLARGADFLGLLVDCPIYTSATLVHRDAFLAAGGYDVRLDAYEDLDLYLRLARIGRLAPCTGGPVTRYRRHRGNTSSDYLYAGALRLADKHLPTSKGRARRLLKERRVDCLWGLGDFAGARHEAALALVAEPRLLGNLRFLKRLVGSLTPTWLLWARRGRAA